MVVENYSAYSSEFNNSNEIDFLGFMGTLRRLSQ